MTKRFDFLNFNRKLWKNLFHLHYGQELEHVFQDKTWKTKVSNISQILNPVSKANVLELIDEWNSAMHAKYSLIYDDILGWYYYKDWKEVCIYFKKRVRLNHYP